MARLYHVTKSSNAEEIWNDGIRNKPPSESWVKDRQSMRSRIDDLGQNKYDNWVKRENAVFFWATHNSAIRYAERFLDPAIIEVHNIDKQLWCLPNDILEGVFSDFVSNNSIEDSRVEYIVQSARVWNNDLNDNLEVWTQPTIPSDKIHQIYNYQMEPLDFEQTQ